MHQQLHEEGLAVKQAGDEARGAVLDEIKGDKVGRDPRSVAWLTRNLRVGLRVLFAQLLI